MLLIQGARQKAVPRRIMGTSCRNAEPRVCPIGSCAAIHISMPTRATCARLLRPRCKRPCGPRATEQRDELAAPHGLSSRPRVEGARKLTMRRDCKSTEVSVIARADLLLVVIQTIISTSQIDDRSRRDFRWFGRLS